MGFFDQLQQVFVAAVPISDFDFDEDFVDFPCFENIDESIRVFLGLVLDGLRYFFQNLFQDCGPFIFHADPGKMARAL